MELKNAAFSAAASHLSLQFGHFFGKKLIDKMGNLPIGAKEKPFKNVGATNKDYVCDELFFMLLKPPW